MELEKTMTNTGTESAPSPKVNDFCITFATVNGSGSQTANTTIMRALFKMGIPVSGKNRFPSNIQGLPTWYSIRVSKDGYLGRVEDDDILVAMNPASFEKDVDFLCPGGVLFYPDDIKLPIHRDDIHVYSMPVKRVARDADVSPTLREYIANMVYVGVVAQILGIDMERISQALVFHFKGKEKAVKSNYDVVKAAYDWAAENLQKTDPYRVENMPALDGYIMADGNTAGALGSIFGGVQFSAWYPITPASTLPEALNEYLPQFRKNPETGEQTYAVIQAEDELSAIGMAIGAGFSGLRSMTATSGPGLSLMAEYLGLAYYAEVPVVVWDVQRVGPSTGLPTRTAQGDLTMANFLSHGDKQYVILLPGTVQECFEFGWKAFDLAERLQTPVLVLTDLDMGMNQWMTEAFEYPDTPMDRGKILWEEDLEKIKGEWGRYLDVDGDGIPYRTVPGNHHPNAAYFARGTGHDDYAHYSEEPDVWEKNMYRLVRKFETARNLVPHPKIFQTENAQIGIIGYGSSDPAIEEAVHILKEEKYSIDYLRLKAIPFSNSVKEFISTHERIYIVEMNRDGQLCQLLCMEYPELANRLVSTAHLDGLPLSARWITGQIRTQEAKS
jgi:2-oxoglutarate/2-oxoacid ferredoxin oxidoreductase subunit alpha